ncbi:MAG: glycosyl hydrolase [Flavobacteriales bacterium]|nr:MAG: glycosyl hydrolase [Flavobacteriales bacterium]|tara:strand:+ start:3668 stop:6784 length:3117 start_codon:yes stop_codon:yes gene_type:complete
MQLIKFFNLSLCVILLFSFEIVAQRKNKSQKNKVIYDQSLYSSLKFREIGPFRGGRSCAVTGVEGNPNLFYFGSTGGGIWKTTDGGKTYKNISDGYFGGSIGAVAVSKSDPNVIYVGGGEVTVRGNVSSGYGIWKSEDAGETWKSCGLPKSRHIPRIVIDPQNPDIVYAAVLGNIYKPTSERGVYKSTNGGKTWSKVLFESNHAGAVELVIDPNNPRNLYAATWRVKRTPYSLSSGGEGSILWKSTDRGNNWRKISSNKGFAQGILGIIGVTVSPVNSDRVWAIVENKDKGGVYRSDDGGETWSHVNDSRALRQRAWYYSKIYADTKDINKVYVMNVSYHKSTDGGETFTSHNAPHGDHHDLWIAPEDNNRMIIGDDGGAQVTYDGGETWSTYHNQPTAQFYRVTTDNSFPYRIYAAQQDNSTVRIKHRSNGSYIDEGDWEPSAGGESAHIAIDPNDNDIVYGGSYGGYLTRVNHKNGSERGINVWPDNPMGYGAEGMKYRFQWNFPIFFSPHNAKKMYAFSNHVHVTENEGQSWEIISPDLTRNVPEKLKSSGGPITQDNTGVEYYCTLFAGGESNLKSGLIWVGSDDGLIHLTKDGGKTWTNVTPKNMPEWMMINSIDPSPFDPGTCYVAGTKYKTGDFKPYLYRTENYGMTWELITNNIKNENFTRVLRADPARKGLLYAGTESGLYISFDDGNSWKPFQQNLPIVPITDLTIKDNSLIVATQGRSIWMLDDLTVLHQLPNSDKNPYLFKPKPTYRLRGSGGESSLTMGTNKPNGVEIHFYIPSYNKGSDKVELSFHDEKGNEIRKFSTSDDDNKLEVKDGGNVFVWDYKYPGAENFDGMVMWSASLNGAKAVPGTYQVRLSVNNFEFENSFKILKSPTSESTVDQMREQFNFVNQINKTLSKAHQSIKKIRKTKLKLNDFLTTFSDNKDAENIIKKANFLIDSLSTVENALYQTKNESRQDPLNFPIKLTNKLGHIADLVTMNDFPPTDQDKKLMTELSEKIDKEIEIFNKLMTNDVSEFNLSFKKLQLDYLIN